MNFYLEVFEAKMSSPGKYVRAPAIESESDSDELTNNNMRGLYVRALQTSSEDEMVEEVDSSLARHSIAPPVDQLELQKRVKELEEALKEMSECRSNRSSGKPSTSPVSTNRAENFATTQSGMHNKIITQFYQLLLFETTCV
ncbi:uncharacterized protein LOC134214549 [Armigeres subalbatus]|uniref:uncharacterized protein LOC134214549 n=1 Tax=Armigeres subalbatus TaxID=124917 RepID=UPI002ED40237